MKWLSAALIEIAPPQPSTIEFSPQDLAWHLTLDQIESNTGYIVNKKFSPAAEADRLNILCKIGNDNPGLTPRPPWA